ncbi:hypothetical protein SmJEL517_g03645 [Synchytrium microbalum]|uniref:Uncharacterized protein n=1 Tax=Synchytrium microbalum TaxID=1806994 RepID=A0A507BVT2_9FUNG|nr:uncharacterized protein SmJEL517_g03645 [Synchytrium microbalum]TPX33490.1 hypothetical protein SmJEL517_g03645 [Synchytrium microbalum]
MSEHGSRHKESKKRSRNDDEDSEHADSRFGQPKITADDYFKKSSEFRLWLKEKEDLYFTELDASNARKWFDKFVKKWNRSKLSERYYRGIASTELHSSDQTRYKWKLKNVDEDQLMSARDSVDDMTQSTKYLNNTGGDGSNRDDTSKRVMGKFLAFQIHETSYKPNEDMDDEDRLRYEKGMAKKAKKSEQSTHQAVLDEIAPKATGRDAILDKKKSITAYHRQEKDTDPEFKEEFLMGSTSSSFQAAVAERERARQRRDGSRQTKTEEKAAVAQHAVSAYRQKEDATIAMLKAMAENIRK